MNNMYEFTSTYDETHSYEIKENGVCPKCNKNMETHINKQVLCRNGTKNMLLGVGCDHPECGGCLIKFDEMYYKCVDCSLDYCKNHAEKTHTSDENISKNLHNMKAYLLDEFKSVYNY